MKKTLLFALGLGTSIASFAQRSAIQSAENYLNNDKDYDHAIEYINKAVADASTQNDPKTYYVEGLIYMAMQDDAKYKGQSPYRKAYEAYMKCISIKANYEPKEAISNHLLVCAYNFFNDGISAYNARTKGGYDTAATFMSNVVTVHDLDGGKRFAGQLSFDTIAAQAKYVRANSFFYGEKYDDALTAYQDILNNKLLNKPDIYVNMAAIYERKSDDKNFLDVINKGRERFPSDAMLRTMEINYYVRSGKQDELVKKLEAAVAADPKNAELLYNLATSYYNLAFPHDASGKDVAKPANSSELATKSEDTYKKLMVVSPDNASYNYNFGALYYNEAIGVNDQMNKLTTSAADNKKFEELKVQRNKLFAEATPYLEKTRSLLGAKVNTLEGEDLSTYKASLYSLQTIYAHLDQMDKVAAVKKDIAAAPSK